MNIIKQYIHTIISTKDLKENHLPIVRNGVIIEMSRAENPRVREAKMGAVRKTKSEGDTGRSQE